MGSVLCAAAPWLALTTPPVLPCSSVILERALRRLEYERVAEKEAKAKAAKEEAEREAMLSVDWHDFVVSSLGPPPRTTTHPPRPTASDLLAALPQATAQPTTSPLSPPPTTPTYERCGRWCPNVADC